MIVAIIINGIAMGCIYGLVALGFSLIFRAMGLINFAQGEMLTVGALTGFSMIVSFKLFWRDYRHHRRWFVGAGN